MKKIVLMMICSVLVLGSCADSNSGKVSEEVEISRVIEDLEESAEDLERDVKKAARKKEKEAKRTVRKIERELKEAAEDLEKELDNLTK
ncbi:MAG: hypothetical protein J6K90_02915 [Tidjanibacter sp.]|nr:hypothetical protein [Tidjanibacter sp.]